MSSVFSSDNLLNKVEALQGQNDALAEKSRHLNEIVQKNAAERRALTRKYLTLAGAAAAAALVFAGLFFLGLRDRAALSGKNKALETSLTRLENENREFAGRANSLQAALDTVKRENTSLQDELKNVRSAVEEKIFLEEILINKTKEIEALRGGGGEEQAATLKSKDEEIVRLAEQNRMLSEKLERLYGAVRQSLGAIDVSTLTLAGLEQAIEAAKKRVEEEWSLVDLGSIKVEGAPAPAPAKQGRVRAVNDEHGFVVVDLGKADGIKKDSVLQVMKNGEWAATLQVLEVRDVMAACGVKNAVPGYKVRVNDSVTVRK